MSPIYEYVCPACRLRREEIRRVGDVRPRKPCHSCSTPVVRVLSVPIMQCWDGERKFPNLAKSGDGTMTFASRKHYDQHLRSAGLYEDSTAPRKCSTRKVKKYGPATAE